MEENGNIDAKDEQIPPSQKVAISINRQTLTLADFPELTTPEQPQSTKAWLGGCVNQCKDAFTCSGECLKKKAISWFPFIGVLQIYQFRKWLLLDVVAGLTIGIMHVPQGMGFAMLASLPPIYGLYTSFFPVLIYFLFTSSRHTSFGTMSLVAMMLGAVVEREVEHSFSKDQLMMAEAASEGQHIDGEDAMLNTSGLFFPSINGTSNAMADLQEQILNVKLGTVLCVSLIVGLMQIVMSFCRLGVLSVYFSPSFISGCNVGAACQIFTTQVRFLLGIHAQSFIGPFKLPKHYVEVFKHLGETNVADLIISIISIFILFTVKFLNQRFKDKIKIPIPIDLIVVILGTIICKFGMLQEKFAVAVVGAIPQGIPSPSLPPMDQMKGQFISDAVPLAIVGFCTSAIMAKLFAMKHEYPVDANQELLANGIANTFGSFFNCFCGSVAPPRTMLFDSVGGKTQFASLVGSVFVLLVLVAIGPLFESLPVAVLSSIIAVALVPFLLGLKDIKPLYRTSKPDLIVWIVTCVCTILLDIKWGIIIGVATSCIMVVLITQRPRFVPLSPVADQSDVFIEKGKVSSSSKSFGGVLVFRFEAPLYYANSEIFMKLALAELAETLAASAAPLKVHVEEPDEQDKDTTKLSRENLNELLPPVDSSRVTSIVLDCSCITYVDTVGQRMLKMFPQRLKAKGLNFALAAGNSEFLDVLVRGGVLDVIGAENVYMTVNDAVACLSQKKVNPRESMA